MIPGLGRSSGEGKGYPSQYSGLENSMDSVVHGVAKGRTRLSDFHFHVLCLVMSLCDPMDSSPPGSSVHRIFHAGVLEWVARLASRGPSLPRDLTHVSLVPPALIGRFLTTSTTWEAPIKRAKYP